MKFFETYFSEIFAAFFIALNVLYCIAFVRGNLLAWLTPVGIALFLLGFGIVIYRKRQLDPIACRGEDITVVKRPFDIPDASLRNAEYIDPFVQASPSPGYSKDQDFSVATSVVPTPDPIPVQEPNPLANIVIPQSLSIVKEEEEPAMFDEIPVIEVPESPATAPGVVNAEIVPEDPVPDPGPEPEGEPSGVLESERVYHKTRAEAAALRKPGDRIYRKTGKGGGYYIVTPKSRA